MSIDAEAAISGAARDHLRECSRCRALLATISDQRPVEDASIEPSAAAAEATVERERRKRMTTRVVAGAAALIVFGLLILVPMSKGQFAPDIALAIVVVGIAISILVAAPLLLLFSAVAHAKTPGGERRFYKRLGPGRWVDGVCVGIAQATGWPLALVRAIFLLLVWFKGVGVFAYIVCSLAMPVHPDDRRYMLQFKIARAWRRFRGGRDSGEFSRP